MRQRFRCLVLLATLACHVPLAGAAQEVDGPPKPPRLQKITDLDSNGKVQTVRTRVKFDQAGRRLSNKVLDRAGRVIAAEEFQYDPQGRLSGRTYSSVDMGLRWRWRKFQYNAAGEPTRNEIVNAKGKKLGHYVWTYNGQGQLSRRERFNADGSLKFYYANIKRDANGNFSTWKKFDGERKEIGVKRWSFGK